VQATITLAYEKENKKQAVSGFYNFRGHEWTLQHGKEKGGRKEARRETGEKIAQGR